MRKEEFSPQTLEQIHNSIYLPRLVKRYTWLRSDLKGSCPFHKPCIIFVHPNGRFWQCFKRYDGNCFDFVMEAENLSFPEAVVYLAKEAKIKLTGRDAIKSLYVRLAKELKNGY